MHTDSSAMPTCLRLRSTVECTATVLMPSVWQARSTRRAISPRLAITTLSSMGYVHGIQIGACGRRAARAGRFRRGWQLQLYRAWDMSMEFRSERVAGAQHAQGDFAAVGNYNFIEHGICPWNSDRSVWQARSTRRAISPRLAITTLSSMGYVHGIQIGACGRRAARAGRFRRGWQLQLYRAWDMSMEFRSERVAGAQHAQGDFAAVGNYNFIEHGICPWN